MALPTSSTYAAPVDLAAAYLEVAGGPIADGSDITSTLIALATASVDGSLYFQVPSTAMTLYCSQITFATYNIKAFGCIESTAAVTIKNRTTRTSLKTATWTQYSGNVWRTYLPSATVWMLGATHPNTLTPKPDYGVSWGNQQASIAAITCDFCWRYESNYLYIYSAVGNPQNYHAIDYIGGSANPTWMWKLQNCYDCVLGTKTEASSYNLTFAGDMPGFCGGFNATATGNWGTGNGAKTGGEWPFSTVERGLVSVELTTAPPTGWIGTRLYVRCNLYRTIGDGVVIVSSPIRYGWDGFGYERVYLGGYWDTSSVKPASGGAQHITWENPVLADPLGRQQGWNGDTPRGYPAQNVGGPRISTGRYPPLIDRLGGGFQMQYQGQAVGGLTLRYGLQQGGQHASWRWGDAEYLAGAWTNLGGNRWTHPLSQGITRLVTRENDLPDGVACGTGGRQRNWGAPEEFPAYVTRPWRWYANSSLLTVYHEGDPSAAYDLIFGVISQFHVRCIDIGLSGSGIGIETTGFPCISKFSNWTSDCPVGASWTPEQYAFILVEHESGYWNTNLYYHAASWAFEEVSGWANVEGKNVPGGFAESADGTADWPRLKSFTGTFLNTDTYSGGVGPTSRDTFSKATITGNAGVGAVYGTSYPGAGDNVFEYSTISGSLTAYGNSFLAPDYLDRIRFLGVARAGIIDARAGAILVCTAISAPAGSTITSSDATVSSVTLNGAVVSLPYTFTGAESLGDEWWLPGVQRAHPAADVTNTGWSVVPSGAMYAALNEETPSDAEYIHASATGAVAEVRLANFFPTPGENVLSYRTRGLTTVSLRQGATEIVNWVENDVDWTTHSRALTTEQVAAITDGTDVRVRFVRAP